MLSLLKKIFRTDHRRCGGAENDSSPHFLNEDFERYRIHKNVKPNTPPPVSNEPLPGESSYADNFAIREGKTKGNVKEYKNIPRPSPPPAQGPISPPPRKDIVRKIRMNLGQLILMYEELWADVYDTNIADEIQDKIDALREMASKPI